MRNGEFTGLKPRSPAGNNVVGHFIKLDRLNLWASYPGEGKSLLADCLAYCVAYGAPWLGIMPVQAGNVMIIDSENPHEVLKARILKIRNGLEAGGYHQQGEIDWQHYTGFRLDDSLTWGPVEDEIKILQPKLIVVDHLAKFHDQDEDTEKGMKKVLRRIEELRAIAGSAILALHHFNKNEGAFFKRLRGSSCLLANSESACEVRTLSKINGLLEKVGIIPQARKDPTDRAFRVKMIENQDSIKMVHDGIYEPIEDVKWDVICHDIFHVFLHCNEARSVADFTDSIQGYASHNEVRGALRWLEDKGLLSKKIVDKGKFIYEAETDSCPWCSRPLENAKN